MDQLLLRKWLLRGVTIVIVIIVGLFLRELYTGDWPDEYYVIRTLQSYYGDYNPFKF